MVLRTEVRAPGPRFNFTVNFEMHGGNGEVPARGDGCAVGIEDHATVGRVEVSGVDRGSQQAGDCTADGRSVLSAGAS